MVGYHAHFCVCRSPGDGTDIYASRRPGEYVVYRCYAPMQGFPDLPIDYAWVAGYWSGSKYELYALMRQTQRDYIAAEVYFDGNSPNTRTLDLFARCGDDGSWAQYELTMPAIAPDTAIDTDDEPYPQPRDWYYGLRRRYIRHVDYDEQAVATGSDADSDTMDVDFLEVRISFREAAIFG